VSWDLVGEAWVTGMVEKRWEKKETAAHGQGAILAAKGPAVADGVPKKRKPGRLACSLPAGLDGWTRGLCRLVPQSRRDCPWLRRKQEIASRKGRGYHRGGPTG
jgi:hypothetical protein